MRTDRSIYFIMLAMIALVALFAFGAGFAVHAGNVASIPLTLGTFLWSAFLALLLWWVCL